MNNQPERLQKIIAESGYASRRKADDLIARGKVKVNGRVAVLGEKAVKGKDIIEIEGKRIQAAGKPVYLLLHKPRGYVTTLSDEQGRKCVADLVADVGARVFPVGRLDRNSEGLLLMTNDGEFANLLTHPRYHVAKVYHVTVRPAANEEQLVKLETGVEIEGRMTLPCRVNVIYKEKEKSVLEFIIQEGRNRQIRKMCEAVGLEVARLVRIAQGSLKLGYLPVGKWRELEEREVKELVAYARSQLKKQPGGKNGND